jgi:hypothetical protein
MYEHQHQNRIGNLRLSTTWRGQLHRVYTWEVYVFEEKGSGLYILLSLSS